MIWPPDGGAKLPDDSQTEVIAFLSNSANYTPYCDAVERIETHISIIFLAGDFAYKLKRAVRFTYLDYSRTTLREKYCRAELELNRRTAPNLYLRVRAITREKDGGLAFDGEGIAVDWVLEMRRFNQSDLLDRLADTARLTPALMRDVTDAIVAFHNTAAIEPSHGGHAGLKEAIAGNTINLIESCPPLDRASVDQVDAASMAALARLAPLLERRRVQGKVRRCHGDLHLRNICLVENRPVLFDCIEFNDAFSCIDVLYDLAFLLMDLLHRDLRHLASIVFNRYLDLGGDFDGLPALPLFMSVRASIRAHVLVAQDRKNHSSLALPEAQSYLALGRELLCRHKPCLVAIGGQSGTGKSTIAASLAPDFLPAPGARVIRSDVVRKNLFHVAPETRLPASAYEHTVTKRVYGNLHSQATEILAAGCTCIIDATFLSAQDRHAVAAMAQCAGVPFFGFWLEAPADILAQRLQARRNDASDADVEVLREQNLAEAGTVDWQRIDATGDIAGLTARIRGLLARDTNTTR